MSASLTPITEGEFVRQLQTKSITKVIAQESVEFPMKFVVVAINGNTKKAFSMRHGRVNELRTWRLDYLGKFLKKHGICQFDVQFQST
tara:strand:- start:492 stop:755 length:264 start_codon:yes stop_codon:yes gene_type:complete